MLIETNRINWKLLKIKQRDFYLNLSLLCAGWKSRYCLFNIQKIQFELTNGSLNTYIEFADVEHSLSLSLTAC